MKRIAIIYFVLIMLAMAGCSSQATAMHESEKVSVVSSEIGLTDGTSSANVNITTQTEQQEAEDNPAQQGQSTEDVVLDDDHQANGSEDHLADFNFRKYLEGYDAVEIERLTNDPLSGHVTIVVKFSNSIVIDFSFSNELDSCLALSEIKLYAADSTYSLMGESDVGASDWLRLAMFDTRERSSYYLIESQDIFFGEASNGTIHRLLLPKGIDTTFQNLVVPYLYLENISLQEDPLSDK